MRELLTLGQALSGHARLSPDRTGVRDLERTLTFAEWDERARRLANALLGLGLTKGDRIAVLAYNGLEWAELYAATAKAGLVAVPINFRLVASEVAFVVADADARVLVVQDQLASVAEEVRDLLGSDAPTLVRFGSSAAPAGFRDYEALVAAASDAEPDVDVHPRDPWALMYTSGTTGAPKGAIRDHRSAAALALVTAVELAIHRHDDALLVMPMCHANSLYFFGSFAYCGATTTIHSRRSFDSEECLRTFADSGASFTSLVPTQYLRMLELPERVWDGLDLRRVSKLMISSAPARAETKREVMRRFPNAGLFELYGATETGWVTMLHPDEQFSKLGSVGRECVGSAPIRLLDDGGVEVPDGEVGELYSNNPYTFSGYWNQPERTAEAFRGDWCTVGDLARRDEDGYLHLVDRKKNLIISGGENIYPSEVEALLATHPAARDAVVIGMPDDEWGERVHAVVVLREGASVEADELLHWCEGRIAGFKRPRSVSFVAMDRLPRTATGKVQHRELRRMVTEGELG